MAPELPNLGALLEHLLSTLDEDAIRVYRKVGLPDYRPRYTPVVRHVAEAGPATIRAIADATSLSHSAASQTVAQMVRDGFATTRSGVNDRRARIVELTDKSRKILPKLRACWKAMDEASRALSPEGAANLESALREAVLETERHSFFDRVVAAIRKGGDRSD